MSWPRIIVAGAVFVIERLAWEACGQVSDVVTELWLFAVSGSVCVPATVAVFVMLCVEQGSGVGVLKTRVRFLVSLMASVPASQTTLAPDGGQPAVEEPATKVSPAGTRPVTATFVAAVGPAL